MKLSSEGPKAAVGDVNGDGKQDLYVCGAKGQGGQLYLQTSAGLIKSDQETFRDSKYFEDTAAQLFDADQDGDLDLFVGSGGNESRVGSRELMNRLYMNDGKGQFTLNSRALPPHGMNTSVVLPYDYDGDGDLDLFVGSRSFPGEYGVSPESYLYRNNGHGEFDDVTQRVAPDLLEIGMVRDAAWADVTGDGRKELVIAGDWMSPQVLAFTGGRLQKTTTGLEPISGLWGSVAVMDVDNDKDLDLVLGNIGENFSLQASATNPLKLWINDFDKNGVLDKVMTKTIDGKDIPVFLKREMAEQFPFLKSKILKHADYAKKTLQDLFSPEVLQACQVKTVNYRKSIIALNNGKGHFTVAELPGVVQLSCVNAIACADINADGQKDIILGGNFTEFMPQLGMIDACRGVVLANQGRGRFNVLSDRKSGYVVDGEVKQISPITINGKKYLVNLVNNARPKLFALAK